MKAEKARTTACRRGDSRDGRGKPCEAGYGTGRWTVPVSLLRWHCALPTVLHAVAPRGEQSYLTAAGLHPSAALGCPGLSQPSLPAPSTVGIMELYHSGLRPGAASAIPVYSIFPAATGKKQAAQLQENNPSFCHNISISKASFPGGSLG